MKTDKIKTGQPIFLKPCGNMARGSSGNKLIKATVDKIGNKFFTIKGASNIRDGEKVHIDSLMHNNGQFSAQFKVYLSEQELSDELELEQSIQYIRSVVGSFGSTRLTLKQCRAIKEIIKQAEQK